MATTTDSEPWGGERYISDLARLRARVSLAELVGPSRRSEVEQIRWAIDPWTLGKEAIALHHRIRVAFGRHDGEADTDAQHAALIDARAWESLAGLGEGGDSFTAFINSAVSYELAGYQANAACVARAAERAVGDRSVAGFAAAVSAFVQRQFFRVEEMAAALNEPPAPALVMDQAAIPALGSENLPAMLSDEDLALLAAKAFGGRALLAASRYFLSGNLQFLEESAQLLEIAGEGFRATGLRRVHLFDRYQYLLISG